jgi:hypothetical protein
VWRIYSNLDVPALEIGRRGGIYGKLMGKILKRTF